MQLTSRKASCGGDWGSILLLRRRGSRLVLIGFAHAAVTGLAGAIAAIALVSIRLAERQGAIVTAIAAVGQRSLTFYIFQSVVFLAVLSPVALGFGGRTGFTGAALVAFGTWVLSLLCAEAMRRRSYRGPAEILLRRLTYRKTA